MVQLPWLYFGCAPGQSGHYLLRESGSTLHAYGSNPLAYLQRMCWDGNLAPQPERGGELYRASLSRLGGWGYSALSWWDRSQDKRGASNSTILAPDLTIAPADMLRESQARMPWVFTRLPQELVLA